MLQIVNINLANRVLKLASSNLVVPMIFTARSIPMKGGVKIPQRLFDITSERVERSTRFLTCLVQTNYPTWDRNDWNVKPEVENRWRR